MAPTGVAHIMIKKLELILWLIGAGVIGFAGYEYYHSQQLLTAYQWTPIYQAISLDKDADFSYEFTADKDTDYYIYLDVERTRDFEKLQCLMGAAFTKNQCHADSSHLDMDWNIVQNDMYDDAQTKLVIASGSSRTKTPVHTYWTHTVGKGIGVFTAHSGIHYLINLHVNQALTELMVLHPKIKIAMHPKEFNSAQADANRSGLITVSLVALVVLMFAGFYFFKERHL